MANNITSNWDTSGSGTIVAAVSEDRRLYCVVSEIRGAAAVVYWTDDGTETGTSLFATDRMPYVEVMLTPPGDTREFTQMFLGGPMYLSQHSQQVNDYAWWTYYDSTNTIWLTVVMLRGAENVEESSERSTSATIVLHAVGTTTSSSVW